MIKIRFDLGLELSLELSPATKQLAARKSGNQIKPGGPDLQKPREIIVDLYEEQPPGISHDEAPIEPSDPLAIVPTTVGNVAQSRDVYVIEVVHDESTGVRGDGKVVSWWSRIWTQDTVVGLVLLAAILVISAVLSVTNPSIGYVFDVSVLANFISDCLHTLTFRNRQPYKTRRG